jgi:hypothetical protein
MVRLIWKKNKAIGKRRNARNKAKTNKRAIKSITGYMAFKKAKT